MTLEEFVAECKTDADRFHKQWLEGASREPNHYPKALEPGEWHEQYLAFLSFEDPS